MRRTSSVNTDAQRVLWLARLVAWESSSQAADQVLGLSDPEERARAVAAIIRRQGRQGTEMVLAAIEDPSEKVRRQALEVAAQVGAVPSEEILMDLAPNDESPEVRLRALFAQKIRRCSGLCCELSTTRVPK